MSYKVHKTGVMFLKVLKVADEKFTLEWQLSITYRKIWWTQMVCFGFWELDARVELILSTNEG